MLLRRRHQKEVMESAETEQRNTKGHETKAKPKRKKKEEK